jgi:predicted DNA-binding transcriptional regulator AlpA
MGISDPDVLERLDRIELALLELAKVRGERVTRAQFMERLGIKRHTFERRMKAGEFPKTDAGGKWLLAEIMEWEARHARH